MNGMDDLVEEFLVESYENLDQLDKLLVTLEENPEEPDLLGAIFRTMHSIKGMTGFLNFHKLEAITHAAETLLTKLRDGDVQPDTDI
ncbi:MAG: Hpt domain-containing protein, partial [Myxococcota bacterium]